MNFNKINSNENHSNCLQKLFPIPGLLHVLSFNNRYCGACHSYTNAVHNESRVFRIKWNLQS